MMPMETQEFDCDGIRVEFKERPAQQDRHHLIVVFSGFRPEHSPYDFDGPASTTLRSHMLWIRDDFNGKMTYYIRNRDGYGISDAVNALIETKRLELGLEKKQCTFIGFSKGGTAALYHGLKYEYPNILVSAPRIRVGSANQDQRPDIIDGMTVSGAPEEIEELDNLLPDLIRARQDSSTNLYWFSSLADHFHATETGPILNDLRKYSNFNYFETNSELVRRHKDVTLYNMALIMPILGALGEGAVPYFGESPNGGRANAGATVSSIEDVRARNEVVAELDTLKVANGRLWVKGLAFAKGVPAPRPNHMRTEIILRGSNGIYKFKLDQVENARLSNRYYESAFCDYSFGAYASLGGVDLEKLPYGQYRLQIRFRQAKVDYPSHTLTWSGDSSASAQGHSLIQIRPSSRGAMLVKRPLLSNAPGKSRFELLDSWLEGNTFQVRGSFVVQGMEASTHQDVKFWAVFVAQSIGSIRSVPLFTYSQDFDGKAVDDPWGVYTHSNFSTRRHRGTSLPDLPPDVYDVAITGLFPSGSVFSHPVGIQIEVPETGPSNLLATLGKLI